LFSQLVLDSIKLRSTPADWAEISDYRARISPFYSNLLPSFVWLNHLFPPDTVVIDFETMISFFLLEMTHSSESWRIYAGFSALSKVLQYSGDKVTQQYFTLIVGACVDSARKNVTMLKPLISDFLHFASLQADKIYAELWNGLVSTLLQHDNECTSYSLALLLQSPQAVELSGHFASFIVKQLRRGKFTQDEAISLITILYEVGAAAIPLILQTICDDESSSTQFKMTTIKRALLRCETRSAIDKVTLFIIEHFKEGGLNVVAQILVRRPRLGLELLGRGAANKAVLIIDDSPEDCKMALQFLRLVLAQTHRERKRTEIAVEVGKTAIHAIAKWGGDRKNGRAISLEAVAILREEATNRAFKVGIDADREAALVVLRGIVAAAQLSAPKLALKMFSSNPPAKRHAADEGEWQSLEMGD
jgi:hypothetical protein